MFAEEDYTRKICFRCEEEHFEAAMISEQEADKMSDDGTFGDFLDGLWGLSAKRVLLMVQNNPDECICFNEKTKEIVSESDRNLKNPKSDILNWKAILSDSLKLGKCGELYAQTLLENVKFTKADENHVEVMVYANEEAIMQLAQSYAPDVIILEPERLRKQIVERLKKGIEGYE